jgi:histone H3
MVRTKQTPTKFIGKAPRKNSATNVTKAEAESLKTLLRPHRYRPGSVALREIRRYQRATDLTINKRPFQQLVKEIADNIGKERKIKFRFGESTLLALQVATESYLVELFRDAQLCASHDKRKTVILRDLLLARKFRGEY